MIKYSELKPIIKQYGLLNNNINNWRFRYLKIKNTFQDMPLAELISYSQNDTDIRVKNEALSKLDILNNYNIRKDFNNVVTIKLIIPTNCNAKCSFCYNNMYKVTSDKIKFLENLDTSIETIVNSISPYFPISLDITGGEPTLDIEFFKKVLIKLKRHYLIKKFCRITLNTNGLHLDDLILDMKDIITYVNISTHHFNEVERNLVFKTYTKSTEDYKKTVLKLLNIGIDTSTVCVLHKNIIDFNSFLSEYVKWCKDVGFVSLRFRNNVSWNSNLYNEYEKIALTNFKTIQSENTNDSTWYRLVDNDGFFIFFLNGVIDTFKTSKGIEYIIHDDGLLYMDYSKDNKFSDYSLPYNLILDVKN